jgi:hypothetical protein
VTLWNDTTDRIDAAYDQVTKRELSFMDAQAVETQVEQELARVIQALELDGHAGGTGAVTGGDETTLSLCADIDIKDILLESQSLQLSPDNLRRFCDILRHFFSTFRPDLRQI